jgi:hypothetical protein
MSNAHLNRRGDFMEIMTVVPSPVIVVPTTPQDGSGFSLPDSLDQQIRREWEKYGTRFEKSKRELKPSEAKAKMVLAPLFYRKIMQSGRTEQGRLGKGIRQWFKRERIPRSTAYLWARLHADANHLPWVGPTPSIWTKLVSKVEVAARRGLAVHLAGKSPQQKRKLLQELCREAIVKPVFRNGWVHAGIEPIRTGRKIASL